MAVPPYACKSVDLGQRLNIDQEKIDSQAKGVISVKTVLVETQLKMSVETEYKKKDRE